MNRLYARTLVPDSPWKDLSPEARKNFIMGFWLLTWGALVLGFLDRLWWDVAIAITVVQTVILLALVRFHPWVFPVQLRIAFIPWLALGAHVPALWVMMPIATIGLGANLAFGYCALSRLLYLLPWNRTRDLTWHVFVRTFLQPPGPGRFDVHDEPRSPPAPAARRGTRAANPR